MQLPAAKITGAGTLSSRPDVLSRGTEVSTEVSSGESENSESPDVDEAELGEFLLDALDGFDPHEDVLRLCE